MDAAQRTSWWKINTARVWRELEAKLKLPSPVPPADRQGVGADFADEVADATCEADLEILLDGYRESAEGVITTCASYAAALGVMVAPRRKGARKAPREVSPQQVFRLRQLMRVLAFVANHILPLQSQLNGELIPPQRVKWEEVAMAWKKAHPGDRHKPDTLRVYYWRARTDPRVSEPYVTRIRKLWSKWAEGILVALSAPEYLSYTLTPDGKLDSVSQRFPARVARALGAGFDRKRGRLRRTFFWPPETQFCIDCAVSPRQDCPAFQALCEAGLIEPTEARE